jgi:predicted HicB family RNase H-like nuclease
MPQQDRHTTAPFPLRLPSEVRAAAELRAKAEERSMNWLLVHLIKQALGIRESTQKPVVRAHTR